MPAENPYQPPDEPSRPIPRQRPPWFRRWCELRTHTAHAGLVIAALGAVLAAAMESKVIGYVAIFGAVVFTIAMVALIPLTIMGLCIGYQEGRACHEQQQDPET